MARGGLNVVAGIGIVAAILLAAVGAYVLLPWLGGQTDVSVPAAYADRSPPDGLLTSDAAVDAGRSLYRGSCVGCHGAGGQGRKPWDLGGSPPPDFRADQYADASPQYLFWRIAEGNTVEPFRSDGSRMPAHKNRFSNREIWQLVAYLASLSRR